MTGHALRDFVNTDDVECGTGELSVPSDLSGWLGERALGPASPPAGEVDLAAAAAADGTWPRLKLCQESGCRWAFLDTSKNRSRAWCSMRVGGNRTKTRAYRARQRSGATK